MMLTLLLEGQALRGWDPSDAARQCGRSLVCRDGPDSTPAQTESPVLSLSEFFRAAHMWDVLGV